MGSCFTHLELTIAGLSEEVRSRSHNGLVHLPTLPLASDDEVVELGVVEEAVKSD